MVTGTDGGETRDRLRETGRVRERERERGESERGRERERERTYSFARTGVW